MWLKSTNLREKAIRLVLFSICALVIGCSPATQTDTPKPDEAELNNTTPHKHEYMSGGAATVFASTRDAFSHRPPSVANNFKLDGAFTSGDHLFRTPLQGVGPILNNNTCQGCHLNDGRGVVPVNNEQPFTSMLVKIGDESGAPDPVYGDQIQTFSVASFAESGFTPGMPKYHGSLADELVGEAYTLVFYETIAGQYLDGEPWELRKPVYKFKEMSFGDFVQGVQFSVRVAPQIFGSGLLDAIPQQDIIALADPDDTNGDGISGKVSWVVDAIDGERKIGKFAYKAQNPSVLQQVAAAFRGDSGLTSRVFPEEPCTPKQASCLEIAQQENHVAPTPDLSDTVLAFVEFYNRTLAVPANRGFDRETQRWDSSVVAGRTHFQEIGCANCHTPMHTTGLAKGSVLGFPGPLGLSAAAEPIEVLSGQTIYPYTDLLLHDMGGSCAVSRELQSGERCEAGADCYYVQRCNGLADGLKQGDAGGTEWKTPPLWGIGLVQTVNPAATFLHDGRARSIEEAILWHGGEATGSLSAFKSLSKTERQQVLAFLNNL